MISVPGDFVTLKDYIGHRFGVALGNAAAGQKRGLNFVRGQNSQDSVDAGFRAIFGLGLFLMIHSAVLIGADIFAALKIKAQEYRHASIARPIDSTIGVKFL